MAIKDKVGKLHVGKAKKSRPGIHSKKRSSKNKNSKNYVKPYNGQGK